MSSMNSIISLIKNRSSAFTLVELLIVIGIISVLAVALLVTINPTEAQRRARDSQRLRDINSLQTLAESWLNEGRSEFCTAGCSSVNGSTATTRTAAQRCATGHWLASGTETPQNVCDYVKTVPVDPANNLTRSCVSVDANGVVSREQNCTMRYRFRMSNGNYEIATLLESESNASKGIQDGGSAAANSWVQILTGPELFTSYQLSATD